MIRIDYARLGRAIAYYENLGYKYVELDWTASPEAIAATCPNPDLAADVPLIGTLIGSAEQAFIDEARAHWKPKGKYCACTPCFRVGDNRDIFHQEMFMKVELWRDDVVDHYAKEEMLSAMAEFAQNEMHSFPIWELKREDLEDGSADLILNGHEIGSFGVRELFLGQSEDPLRWVFGTGLAEPRFSMAMTARQPEKYSMEIDLD